MTNNLEKSVCRICTDGVREWYKDGKLHREDGPAIDYPNGSKKWYQNGERHRTDGPALEYTDGTKYWFQNGELHRTDGPAIELPDGSKHWYVRGTHITDWIKQQGISDNPTKEEQMLIVLNWC